MLAVVTAVALLLTSDTAAQAAPAEADVRAVTVADGLRRPWSVAFLPGGEFLVSEKDGGLVRIDAAGRRFAVAGTPEDLDSERQDARDNTGLFDVALHPNFAANRRLFLAYASRGEGGTTTRLVQARLVEDRLVEMRTLFKATPRTGGRFHYGGALLVAEGWLYLTVGERHYNERDNPPLPAAQDPADRRGKIWRFTLDGAPDSQPYASGIRASQGMAWDPARRIIWFTEHGSVGGDELNRLEAGANYGWPIVTTGRYRNEDYRPGRALPDARYTDPVHAWTDRTVAPTGLTAYYGDEFPEWRGDLIVGGLSTGYLMRLDLDGEQVVAVQYLMRDAPVRLRNVRQAPDGRLYAVTDETNGRLLRLVRQ